MIKFPEHYSKYFNHVHLHGINKVGKILVPGDSDLPSFISVGAIKHIDRVAAYMSAKDLQDLKFLLAVLARCPQKLIWLVIKISDSFRGSSSAATTSFRLISYGLKGLIYTLYYTDSTSDRRIRKAINWHTQCGESNKESKMSAEKRAFTQAKIGAAALRKTTLDERLTKIKAIRESVLKRRDEIITVIQQATGKTRSDALISEIFSVLDHLDYLEKFAPKILADRKVHTPIVLMGKKSRVYFEPMGVVLVISPWNYPFYQAITPITLSFMCGNATVYKPSEWTPMKGLVESILSEAGFDPSWVQVVYGDGASGAALIDEHPDKIFFTGSTRTGKRIMEQASKYLIPVELELGGKDPMIVFEDANLKRAVAGAVWGAFTNTGQSCTSVERLYVHEKIYNQFKQELVLQTRLIKQHIDQDGDADIGAMTMPDQVGVVAKQLESALAAGAKMLTGEGWDRRSKLIPPIILEGVTPQMSVYREETFGPLLPIIPFKTEEEVIAMANDSDFGLSASVWTKDPKRADRVARALVTGNVSINNVMLSEGNHALPFGGVKQSGFGRYKGEFGFYSFSNIKSVIIDANSPKIEANWYPYTRIKYALFTSMMLGAFGRGLKGFARFAINGLKLEGYSAKATRKPQNHV